MKLYRYRALTPDGQLDRGLLLASDPGAVETLLADQGRELLSAHKHLMPGRIQPCRREIIEFCLHLEQLISAGIPLLDALRDLEQSTTRPTYRAGIRALVNAVEHGMALSAAMRSLPGCFDSLLIALIAAGEAGGHLPEVLRQTGSALQRVETLRARTVRQLIYPALAASVAIAAMIFLLIYLVPQIRGFLVDSGHPLPTSTQALFTLSNWLERQQLVALLGLPCIFFATLFLARRYPPWLEQLDRGLLALPVFGTIQLKSQLARLSELLGLLYACGIPLLRAMEMSTPSVANRIIQSALRRTAERLEAGTPIHQAFASEAVFPALFLRMLQIGETTGRLDAALIQLAERFQQDANEASTRLHALIEPAVTLSIGIFLGWLMLATLQPIYDIVGALR